MWNFSEDEWFFFVAAAVVTVFGGVRYYRPLISISLLGRSRLHREVLAFLPLVAMIPTCVVLSAWADPQVVGHLDYSILFLLGGSAWIFSSAILQRPGNQHSRRCFGAR